MSIRRRFCFLLDCDDCHIPAGEDEHAYHFETDRHALDYAADHGWQITDDGHLSCPDCVGRSFCARHGHTWDHWIPCACHGLIAAHTIHGCPLYRFCTVCDAMTESSLALLPTTDEPHRSR